MVCGRFQRLAAPVRDLLQGLTLVTADHSTALAGDGGRMGARQIYGQQQPKKGSNVDERGARHRPCVGL